MQYSLADSDKTTIISVKLFILKIIKNSFQTLLLGCFSSKLDSIFFFFGLSRHSSNEFPYRLNIIDGSTFYTFFERTRSFQQSSFAVTVRGAVFVVAVHRTTTVERIRRETFRTPWAKLRCRRVQVGSDHMNQPANAVSAKTGLDNVRPSDTRGIFFEPRIF